MVLEKITSKSVVNILVHSFTKMRFLCFTIGKKLLVDAVEYLTDAKQFKP